MQPWLIQSQCETFLGGLTYSGAGVWQVTNPRMALSFKTKEEADAYLSLHEDVCGTKAWKAVEIKRT